jgi:hypothetical protein
LSWHTGRCVVREGGGRGEGDGVCGACAYCVGVEGGGACGGRSRGDPHVRSLTLTTCPCNHVGHSWGLTKALLVLLLLLLLLL